MCKLSYHSGQYYIYQPPHVLNIIYINLHMYSILYISTSTCTQYYIYQPPHVVNIIYINLHM